MKNFKAVSMDCNKEQFESMRQELIYLGCEIDVCEDMDYYSILVNNNNSYEKRINNLHEDKKDDYNRTYIGEFDKQSFLKACGKVEHLSEVCVLVNDANREEVKSWIRKNYPDCFDNNLLDLDVYISINKNIGVGYSQSKNSNIVVSLLELDKIKNGKVEKVKKSGWYICSAGGKWMMYADFEKGIKFGFRAFGNWCVSDNSKFTYAIKATNEQVLQRLTEEAEQRGYVGKDLKIKLDGTEYLLEKEKGSFQVASNIFFYQGATIMKNGIWADIVVEQLVQSKANMLRDRGWNVYPEQAADELIHDISSVEVFETVNVSELIELKKKKNIFA